MVKIENYPNAYKEIYVIFQNINKEYLEQIPQSFMTMIETKMNKDYEFKLDMSVDFEKQKILKETKVVLAYIFLNYWSTSDQKLKIEQKFRNDISKEEQKTKYNLNELFLNKSFTNLNQNKEVNMIEYKPNIFVQFINKIKNLLKSIKHK